MSNLEIYNKVASVPKEAQKTIKAGRLQGMTDINPMWRIKVLTENFGVCGIGWKYIIKEKRLEEGADGTVCAFVDIDLFVRDEGEWSDAIQGTGGSQFVSKEKGGLYTNDECFKMALTDALGVACKALGIGADVYWEAGRTKYSDNGDESSSNKDAKKSDITMEMVARLFILADETKTDRVEMIKAYKVDNPYNLKKTQYEQLVKILEERKANQELSDSLDEMLDDRAYEDKD